MKTTESAWQPLPWATKGQKVWLQGSYEGSFQAYGPHTVHDARLRHIASGSPYCRGRLLRHWGEDLLVPTTALGHTKCT